MSSFIRDHTTRPFTALEATGAGAAAAVLDSAADLIVCESEDGEATLYMLLVLHVYATSSAHVLLILPFYASSVCVLLVVLGKACSARHG